MVYLPHLLVSSYHLYQDANASYSVLIYLSRPLAIQLQAFTQENLAFYGSSQVVGLSAGATSKRDHTQCDVFG